MNTKAHMSRRDLLQRGALLSVGAAAGTVLPSCSTAGRSTPPEPAVTPVWSEDAATPPSSTRTLLIYFSRPGENYYNGGRCHLNVGNTEVLANLIRDLIDCDVYRIEAADPYPASYDATVDRNVDEQNANARPTIANSVDSINQYDAVLVGSPIWNVRPPMIMTTFLESYDFAGTEIHPFVTYAVSGLGRTEAVYADALSGARIRPGLAVRGEEVSNRRSDVEAWLASNGLTT